MKKLRQFKTPLGTVMKMSFLQLIIIVVAAANTYGNAVSAQELLRKRVTFKAEQKEIRTILSELESIANVRFVYSVQLVPVNQKVSLSVADKTIAEVLDELFRPNRVSCRIVRNKIVLQLEASLPPAVIPEAVLDNPGEPPLAIRVKGRVSSGEGEGLPGVSILLKGTQQGTITDAEGAFTIEVPDKKAVLVFSFVGYTTREIEVADRTTLDIVLEVDEKALEEVVVVGYGSVRKRDLTGAVASVSGEDLRNIPVTSASEAIVGRLAGVQVSKTEGAPDADIKIRIRGGGSITQDNSPLFLVDGFPVDNINDIAPADILSIDVLKDASSTAIYGARGANGVILITTRGGKEGAAKISFNTYYGVKRIAKTLKVLNPYEYVYWQYELQNTSDRIDDYFGDFRDFELYKQVKGTNWQDEILGQTGTSFSNNLSFRGGAKNTTYSVSLTRNDEKEIMIGSGFSRTNLTIKTTHKLKDWLSLDLNSRFSDYYLKGAGTSSGTRLSHIVQFRPVNGMMDYVDTSLDEGDYEAASIQVINPLKQTLDDYRRTQNRVANLNAALNIRFSRYLSYRFDIGRQFGSNRLNRFYGINTSNTINYGRQPIASITQTGNNSFRMANVLTYNRSGAGAGHNLNFMIGNEINTSKLDIVSSTSRYFPKYIDAVSALSMMDLGVPDPTSTTDDPTVKMLSFFGRANYDFKGRYLASVSMRTDGSSKFVPGNRWGYFPAASVGWRIHDELFMQETHRWLSDLKIRFSMGMSGNNRIPSNAWQKVLSVNVGKIALGTDGENPVRTPFLQVSPVLSNPGLKWETTITNNLGLDFGLFKNRLTGTVEFYKNITKDLLLSATIPASSGYIQQWQNIGQTSNRGIEFSLTADIISTKDFELFGTFNIGINRNRIDKLGETKRWTQSSDWFTSNSGPSGDYLIEEGGQVGLMYGYQTDGMYGFEDFDYNNGSYVLKEGVPDNRAVVSPKRFWPGTIKYKDQNGDNVIDAENDKVVIGNATPKHSGGFNLTARYKGFDLSAFFNWVYGNSIYNANKLYFSMSATGYTFKNLLAGMSSENRFIYHDKVTGALVSDPAELQELNKNSKTWAASYNYGHLHSWVIEDGSFLRLNNLVLGYSIPKEIVNRLRINSLRIYGTFYNIWTWTKYTGFDPEVDTRRSTPLTPGIDWNAYPRSRTFNFGLNLEF